MSSETFSRIGRFKKTVFLSLAGCLLGGFVLLPGCLNLKRPGRYVEQYTLEYAPPEISGLPALEASLSLSRFQEARTFHTSAMIYRPGPFQLDSYQYHRWRVHPADLVGDYLLRDLRQAALFKAVFANGDPQEGGFLLEGAVEEFFETEEQGQRQAVLGVSVTLLDAAGKSLPERVLFQKRYRLQEALAENSPRGLAQGMSRAMAKFSAMLIRDVYDSARSRKK
jgi:ABC-type uncharacterized transport system auxiliary subunit